MSKKNENQNENQRAEIIKNLENLLTIFFSEEWLKQLEKNLEEICKYEDLMEAFAQEIFRLRAILEQLEREIINKKNS